MAWLILLLLLLLAVFAIMLFLRSTRFGALATTDDLAAIKSSDNYREGKFQNQSFTPDLTEGVTYPAVIREFLFGKNKRATPKGSLPSTKTDLHALNPKADVLVWFGHSSYFLQVDEKRILVDPVFSGNASPLSFTTRSYKGSDVYTPDDIPSIDYLFISHDHWDHLDYWTIIALRSKIKTVVTGLGTGSHLRRWGFDRGIIFEKDWNEALDLGDGFSVHTTPARHFSGRGLKRNQALWLSFVLKTPSFNIFLGGDSGYDKHFKEIGKEHGPFDLAILECGQYDKSWRYIHMLPDEVAQAAEDLRAKELLPVHWGKFTLGNHAWDDPIIEVMRHAQQKGIPVLHPMIGEALTLANPKIFSRWWEQVA